MFTITKRFDFAASHQLTHLAATQPDHQCARLHGHNYSVEVELKSPFTGSDGFVRDYGELKVVKDFIDTRLDHRHLNDVVGDAHGVTAEHLAHWLYHCFKPLLPELAAVRVKETEKTCAEYRPGAR